MSWVAVAVPLFFRGAVAHTSAAKIRQFSELEMGWRFGEGVATTPAVARRALRLVIAAESLGWQTDVFPGVSGELLVDANNEDKHYEFILEIDGSLTLIRTEDDEDVERLPNSNDEDAIERLRRANSPCNIFDFSTPAIGNPRTNALAASHSDRVQFLPEEFLSSIPSALGSTVIPNVSTPQSITKSGQLQPSFGSWSPMNFALLDESFTRLKELICGVTTKSTASRTIAPKVSSKPITAIKAGKTFASAGTELVTL